MHSRFCCSHLRYLADIVAIGDRIVSIQEESTAMKRSKPRAGADNKPKADKPLELTEREKTVVGKFLERRKAEAPRLKVVANTNGSRLVADHRDNLVGQLMLMEELGTTDLDFHNGLISQLANAGAKGHKVDEQALNFMLSVVKGIKPKDQVESMLAAQMAGIHMATMTMMRRLAHAELIDQQNSAERALNKLARTFATQMEALKRYRTGGEQRVTVQHVSVSEGGQAIVGNVTQTSREGAAERVSPVPQLTHAKEAPMTILGAEAKKPEPVGVPRRRVKSDGKSSA